MRRSPTGDGSCARRTRTTTGDSADHRDDFARRELISRKARAESGRAELCLVKLLAVLMSADTGYAEKGVLVGVTVCCVYVAARIPTDVERLQARLHHR